MRLENLSDCDEFSCKKNFSAFTKTFEFSRNLRERKYLYSPFENDLKTSLKETNSSFDFSYEFEILTISPTPYSLHCALKIITKN